MYYQATSITLRAGIIAGAIVLFFPVATYAEDAVAEKADTEAAASAVVSRHIGKSGVLYGEKFDAEAAVSLANRDNCWKCHDLSKKKEGPTYQSVAEKYRGKPEAVDKLVKHITLGKDVIKLSDGHQELHKFDIKRPPDQVRNLILYILGQ